MKARDFQPGHLDVAAFAQDGAELTGRWPLAALPRLAASLHPEAAPVAQDEVRWTARGERRQGPGLEKQVWLHLGAQARLALECQRCLRPLDTPIEVERSFRFVAGEDQAAALDAESDDDVLALTRSLDLQTLLEDELLLALPLVPRHGTCPQPLPMSAGQVDADAADEPASPFDALRALKRSDGPH